MVKTRRSNGENGEAEAEDDSNICNDPGSVSDEKDTNWTRRELRSSQYKVTRKLQHWPNKYSRRLRTIKMPRIVFPESDTEPEKYSRRSRQVRVFFAGDAESPDMRIRRSRSTKNNSYMKDNEDKPIQQNVRRSCRKRKLLHHNFNESWITNELKVRGYPGLYGIAGTSSSDEFYSGDERNKKQTHNNHAQQSMDEDAQSGRQRRTSARFNNSIKKLEATESDSDGNNETVIEKKPVQQDNDISMEKHETKTEQDEEGDKEQIGQDSESNQTPARSTRTRRNVRQKKDYNEVAGIASDSDSSESDSEIMVPRPRRSNRTRKQPAFVEIAPRQTRNRGQTFTIRKKPYSLRERKPRNIRRKAVRSQSPTSSTSSSSDSSDSEDLNVSMKNKTKGRQKSRSMDDKKTDRALKEIQPVELDGSVRFSSIGGLEEHIRCLREMVLFPLMYRPLFEQFSSRPPKGVLFHGPPGTGKTLLARALANECSLLNGRKVSFFMRKGADCLKKWVGESERHLKLLFQQANKMKPSIIFFDEIDALAPVRSVRQEQVHASVVGTLLAEMDGLCDRGEVVIIGATNRLDAVDPALRRPGRFDRELYFPPPHLEARKEILNIYTKQWQPRPSQDMIEYVASITNGYGGSDLKAICSEAVLKALRRVYPQVYQSEKALLIDATKVQVLSGDLSLAALSLGPSAGRALPLPRRALPRSAHPLLSQQLNDIKKMLKHCSVAQNNKLDECSLSTHELLIVGECASTHLAPALLSEMESYAVKELSLATLHSALAFTHEQAMLSMFSECRRSDSPCVLWVSGWSQVERIVGDLLRMLWTSKAAGDYTLLLATDQMQPDQEQIEHIFPSHKNCVYHVREPTSSEVMNFLRPIITEAPLKIPQIQSNEPLPELPLAPPPPPIRESPEEMYRRKRKEDYKLRELRIFLRDICRKLASNRRFYKFTKPVDLEEVTDYLEIVKQPMDLETMMTKVDMHQYNCAKEFLDDVDLICANALEYNPDSAKGMNNRTSSDKQIRHEACSLRDHAHALIDVEMDSDFEMECQEIARKRQMEGTRPDADLPDFIYTASNLPGSLKDSPLEKDHSHHTEAGSAKRKRRKNNWSKGMVTKRARTTPKNYKETLNATDEEYKENLPVTSTPLPNGDAQSQSLSSQGESDEDDEPLRPPPKDRDKIHSPNKSNERTTKNSPKKRNSGMDDGTKVLINKTELDNLLYKYVKPLRTIGLEALLDLHSQLDNIVRNYSHSHDRTKLPGEMHEVISRYVTRLAKS